MADKICINCIHWRGTKTSTPAGRLKDFPGYCTLEPNWTGIVDGQRHYCSHFSEPPPESIKE